MSSILYGELGHSSTLFYGVLDTAQEVGALVTEVNSGNVVTSSQTGATFSGQNLGDTTGDRTVSIIQGAVEITQTQQSGDYTGGVFDVVFTRTGTDLNYGAATFKVLVDGVSATQSITITTPSGKSYVNIATPDVVTTRRITSDNGDLASGDQVEISNVVGGEPSDVNLNTDGTFDADDSVISFDCRVWSASDKTWGSVGSQILQDISSTGPTGATPKAKARWLNYLRSRF